jgi:hypothetical protein
MVQQAWDVVRSFVTGKASFRGDYSVGEQKFSKGKLEEWCTEVRSRWTAVDSLYCWCWLPHSSSIRDPLEFGRPVRRNALIRQRGQCFVMAIPGEILSVSERNTEENLSVKGVPPSLKEPLQGDPRGCQRVLPLLFDDIYSAFRKQNIAKRIGGTVRDCESVHYVSPVGSIRRFSLHIHKVDAVFHTRYPRIRSPLYQGSFRRPGRFSLTQTKKAAG